jgi:HEPN domain-containing protein
VEKYLKALLTMQGTVFPKIHDLGEPIALLPADARVGLSVEEQRLLTLYATVTRYPGDYEPVSVEEARRAVALARRVRTAVRSLFPRERPGRHRG